MYVCTYWGVRSKIAALLTDASRHPGLVAESAGFENGTIGELPRQVMRERGLDLPVDAPPTLFSFADEEFDYVVTLCDELTHENYKVLYDTTEAIFGDRAEIVHWNVPDFMGIKAQSPETRRIEATNIVDGVDRHVQQFLKTIAA